MKKTINYFTLLYFKLNNINKGKCDSCLDITVNSVFSKKTLIFLMRIYKKVLSLKEFDKDIIFHMILDELKD